MKSAPLTDVSVCYHCGDPCKGTVVQADEKDFCCEGCQTVYELLATNSLCTYYDLDENPGLAVKSLGNENRFDYLLEESVKAQLLDFQDGTTGKVTFKVPQMHCSSCIWLLENLYKLDAGVVDARVNFLRKEISVTYNQQKTNLRNLVRLLARIGYEPFITLADLKPKKERKSYTIYYKLGIAGFCFGNVMMLSFPDYFSVADEIQRQFGSFFGFLNILLALPVFVFSARGFFESAGQGLRQRMINIDVPIAVGLLALFFVSLHDILTASGPGYLDSFTGLVFFMLIGKYVQQRTYDSLTFDRDYTAYFPVSVNVLRKGEERNIPVKDLIVGDRIRIRNQELIPADAILLRGQANIDYSFVTGESVPVAKVAGEIIYAGGRQVGESLELEVVKEVSQGYLTQLWNNDIFNKEKTRNLGSYANAVGKYFILVTLLLSVGSLFYWVPRDPDTAIKAFTSVLIIACPCALSLATPFTLGGTLRVFGRNKFYLKNPEVVEALAKVDLAVFDKTGTLTEPSASEASFVGEELREEEQQLLRSLLRHSTHPLSQTIYRSLSGVPLAVEDYQEVPGKGVAGTVNGTLVKVGSAAWTGVTAEEGASPDETRVYLTLHGQPRGYYTFGNVYRPGLQRVVDELKPQMRLAVLSGDNAAEEKRLRQLFGAGAELNFRQSPVDKLQYVRGLKEQGHRVLMVGDGLNDAGALQQSEVGIALTDNVSGFSPSCDGILDAAHFARLSLFVRFAKVSMRIILASFGVSFIYNIIGLTMAVTGQFTPIVSAILMPTSTLSVILFATLAVWVAAKRMGL